MTVKEIIQTLDPEIKIQLVADGITTPFNRYNVLQMAAYGDYVVCRLHPNDEKIEIELLMLPVKQ